MQAPGVTQDSAASGLLHVRNDHANVQFRINGVMLPDGLTGFGSILDASWIGSIALVVGALPAEYGLRTVGLVDITTRADIFNNSGLVSIYGGSQGTFTPTIQYGGTFGSTCPATVAPAPGTRALPSADCFPGVQYFFTGRYLQTKEGIENSTASYSPIHDFSQQGKDFAYMSTFVDPYTRLSLIAGTSTSTFQIPNTPGQPVGLLGNPPVVSAFGVTTFNSALLNENQFEDTQYGVLALQRSINGFNGQISYFTRYDRLHYSPDPLGDLLINGVAPDVVLASAVTSTPLAFLKIATEVKDKRFHPGMLEFGMQDGMVRVVFNPKLESRIPAAALQRARNVEHELATGQLVLPPTLNPGPP